MEGGRLLTGVDVLLLQDPGDASGDFGVIRGESTLSGLELMKVGWFR